MTGGARTPDPRLGRLIRARGELGSGC
ncbi:protein of unknown function [Paraburkholderia kururiensis]